MSGPAGYGAITEGISPENHAGFPLGALHRRAAFTCCQVHGIRSQLPEQRHGRFLHRFDGRRRDELRSTDLAEDDARQQAASFNVYNQYGQPDQADRREGSPPIEVESDN